MAESRPRFEVRYATEQDVPAPGQINSAGFESTGLYRNAFANVDFSAISGLKGAWTLKHLANPQMHALAAVDSDTKEIVAYCRWIIPTGLGCDQPEIPLSEDGAAVAANPMSRAPPAMNEGPYNAFKKLLEQGREKYVTERVMIVDLLATAPQHQRKGIGRLCMRWGLEKADALKAKVYLEATMDGYPLYSSLGFKPLDEITLDYTQWGGQGSQSLILMMRDPQ